MAIDLSGITFEAEEIPVYSSEIAIAKSGAISVKVVSDETFGKFESYDSGLNLDHLKQVYKYALSSSAKHVVIDDELKASFHTVKPSFVNEEPLLSACDWNCHLADHSKLRLLQADNKQPTLSEPSP